MNIQLEIVTLCGVVYKKEVQSVTLPTESGIIGVFARHTPLISIIKLGEIVVKEADKKIRFTSSEGVLEVRPNSEVIIVVEKAEELES